MKAFTKENLKLLVGAVLFSALFTAMIAAVAGQNPQEQALRGIHQEELQIELKIGETKATEATQKAELERTQAELEELRAERTRIFEEKNSIINSQVQPPEPEKQEQANVTESTQAVLSYDLDRLAYAVSVAETGNCTTGSAISRNNCFGIMHWAEDGTPLGPKYYASHEESFADFKRIWSSFYGAYPTHENGLAKKWTGNQGEATIWLENVNAAYAAM